ncbi:MAG: hypothetical protein PHT57_17485 [Rhodoferax sp.]|nr:hypothetical protein [Rhodoferax sp.]
MGVVERAGYRALNKVDTLSASNALRRLRDAGLFCQQGRGSATWYQPTEKLTCAADAPGTDPTQATALSGSHHPCLASLAVLEFKGAHLVNDPYEIEKSQVGALWAQASAGRAVFGWLTMAPNGQDMAQQLDTVLQ